MAMDCQEQPQERASALAVCPNYYAGIHRLPDGCRLMPILPVTCRAPHAVKRFSGRNAGSDVGGRRGQRATCCPADVAVFRLGCDRGLEWTRFRESTNVYLHHCIGSTRMISTMMIAAVSRSYDAPFLLFQVPQSWLLPWWLPRR